MINRLIELEQTRFAAAGYDTVVYPSEVSVSVPRLVIPLGGESWVLTGIRCSDGDLMGADHRVSISSPTNAVQATERAFAQMGESIHRLLRHHLVIHTAEAGKEFSESADIPAFQLLFVRIVPTMRKAVK